MMKNFWRVLTRPPSTNFWGILAVLGLINIVSVPLLKETSVAEIATDGIIGVIIIYFIAPFSIITAAFLSVIVDVLLTIAIFVWVFVWFSNRRRGSKDVSENEKIHNESNASKVAVNNVVSKPRAPYRLLHLIRTLAPDLLIQLGIYLFVVHSTKKVCGPTNPYDIGGDINCDPNWPLIVAIILITIGANIAIRRYLKKVRPATA